jgi:hypothetical protein
VSINYWLLQKDEFTDSPHGRGSQPAIGARAPLWDFFRVFFFFEFFCVGFVG